MKINDESKTATTTIILDLEKYKVILYFEIKNFNGFYLTKKKKS